MKQRLLVTWGAFHHKKSFRLGSRGGEIGRKDPNTFFLLVGDGPLRPQVENQLIREEIFNRTILTGLRRDVPNMLSAMDISCLPHYGRDYHV